MTMNLVTTEASASAAKTGTAGRFRIQIIEGNRLGSSGYWPRETIERDGPVVFGRGTHIFLDHLSESESWDRPEGSVGKLAGVIDSDPVYEEASDENGHSEGLYAEAQFFPMYHEFITAIAPYVGMSIRAMAEAEPRQMGTDENGHAIYEAYITKIHEGMSVDVVTKAGAGGRILEAIESERPNIPPHIKDKLLPDSAEESNKGEIDMGALTEETASALVEGIGKLNDLLAKPAAAEASPAEEAEQPEVDADKLVEAITKVQTSDLAESARARVLDAIKESKGAADVDALIAAEAEYTKKILEESGGVGRQVGGSADAPIKTTFTNVREASKAWA